MDDDTSQTSGKPVKVILAHGGERPKNDEPTNALCTNKNNERLNDDEKEFLTKLPPDWIKKYLKEKDKIVEDIQRNFENTREIRESQLNAEIAQDKTHREIINICIYPFTQNGSLSDTGYQYVRQNPLAEFEGTPNFDFLLFKNSTRCGVAIFGECKGGSVSNPNTVIDDMVDKKCHVNKNIQYIKSDYLKLPADSKIILEYVLAVPWNVSDNVLNRIIERGEEIVTWAVPRTGDPEMSIKNPQEQIKERHKFLHHDKKLKKRLNNVKSNRKFINIFLCSHTFSKLQALILAASWHGDVFAVDKTILRNNISQDMLNIDDKVIVCELESIIEKGLEIGFLEHVPNEEIFRVISRGYRPDVLERTLLKKWIDYTLKIKLEDEKKDEISKLRVDILARAKRDVSKLDFYFKAES